MKTHLIWLLLALSACGENTDVRQTCQEIQPEVQATFADGSVKSCKQLSCSNGCQQWVCRAAAHVALCGGAQ